MAWTIQEYEEEAQEQRRENSNSGPAYLNQPFITIAAIYILIAFCVAKGKDIHKTERKYQSAKRKPRRLECCLGNNI